MHTMPMPTAGGGVAPPPALATSGPAGVGATLDDFIPHPAAFPLRFRRHSPLPWRRTVPAALAGDVGLSFHSPRYLPAGTAIELEIPLRGVTQRFVATVVLVREEADGYQLGLWFTNPDDASRARLVERICHTECYLRTRRPSDA
ncbi:MAG: PilZ domain-containing protein [Gammaproteobacteria bacterium]